MNVRSFPEWREIDVTIRRIQIPLHNRANEEMLGGSRDGPISYISIDALCWFLKADVVMATRSSVYTVLSTVARS